MVFLRVIRGAVCIFAVKTAVEAFQPPISSRPSTTPVGLFSSPSSSQPSTMDVENDINAEPSVKVEVVSSNVVEAAAAKTAALTSGPSYLASLENSVRPSKNDNHSSPKADVVPTERTTSARRPTRPTTSAAKARKNRTTKTGSVKIAESMEELLDTMDGKSNGENRNTNDGALTLILFHAHYCKICQRAGMQLNKAAKEYPGVIFAKVESQVFPDPVADSLRTLGVSKFPFVQIYRRGQCVASFSTGPTHMFMRKVRDTLDLCLERDEECWDSFTTEFASEIESNRSARRTFGPMP